MKVIIFGASGMVGQGVLRECLADDNITAILSIGRSRCGIVHDKLREIERADLMDYAGFEHDLAGYDACFFCLGVSAAGMSEREYTRITYDLTLRAAKALLQQNPQMTFCYVSGTGTDGTEKGRSMWARVKGRTENALLDLPFKASYMFRPGYIQPLEGIKSKTPLYRFLYAIVGPLYPILHLIAPAYITTTKKVGRAMIRVACDGYHKRHLENRDINALAELDQTR